MSVEFSKEKLEKANAIYAQISPLIDDYDKLGATAIAKQVSEKGLLKEIEVYLLF
mgnify:CR=1 FL=1